MLYLLLAVSVVVVAVFDANEAAASVGAEFARLATILVTLSLGIAALVNIATDFATAARTGIRVGGVVANAVGVW